jgi:hypothetical protein
MKKVLEKIISDKDYKEAMNFGAGSNHKLIFLKIIDFSILENISLQNMTLNDVKTKVYAQNVNNEIDWLPIELRIKKFNDES